jgi:hypothetical protein
MTYKPEILIVERALPPEVCQFLAAADSEALCRGISLLTVTVMGAPLWKPNLNVQENFDKRDKKKHLPA